MNNPSASEKTYFKGLNGIRALAALGVLIGHTVSALNQFPRYAVIIFFTLSGFLITYLLLQEKTSTATINLKKFYMRRILRIWPAYFLFIITIICSHDFIIKDGMKNMQYLPYFFVFLQNIPTSYLRKPPTDMSHLWSIAIEEQFYLFWPLLLLFVKQQKRFLLIFIILIVIVRTLVKAFSVTTPDASLFYLSESWRFDCMATGALFAIFYFEKNTVLLKYTRYVLIPISFWSFVIIAVFYHFNTLSIYSDNLVSIITGAFIVNQIVKNKKTSLLENPFMSFFGNISYGIYLYHPLFISLAVFVFGSYSIHPRHRVLLPAVMAATIVFSWLSYKLLEQPFLRIKKKYAVVK